MEDDEPDPWKPLREKVGEDLKESYLEEVQQFLDRGKYQHYARLLLSMSYYLQVGEGYKAFI